MTDAPPPKSRTILADVLASFVVFMVALPLCVAIAKACGLPPEAGVITGIVGGLVVGPLAGSPLQVSGPAAGLIVLVLTYVNAPDGATRLGWIVLLGGLLQLVAGALRLGQWFRAVSPAVVLGMLAGIGLIILAKQFHVLFDRPAPDKIHEAFLTGPATVLAAFEATDWNGAKAAGLLGLITIAVMAGWKSIAPKSIAIVPAAVVAVVAATAVTEATGWSVAKVQVSRLEDGFRWIDLADWRRFLLDGAVWGAAVTVALIASAESLLCASAVDAKHTGPRTQFNRELAAQGLGNAICGVLGVLPMTGVIVRSAANVEAGAKTRLSAILHGAWLLLFVVYLPFLLTRVPIAALAGVLVFTGYKLLEIPEARKLLRESRVEFAIFLATAFGVVLADLLAGVLFGIGLTAIRLLYRFSHIEIVTSFHSDGRRIDMRLEGAGTFLSLPRLATALENVPRGMELHVHLERLYSVDHAIFDLLHRFKRQYEATGGTFTLDYEDLHLRFRGRPNRSNDT
jgi:MFS superfamily sulfate permease-like transporter